LRYNKDAVYKIRDINIDLVYIKTIYMNTDRQTRLKPVAEDDHLAVGVVEEDHPVAPLQPVREQVRRHLHSGSFYYYNNDMIMIIIIIIIKTTSPSRTTPPYITWERCEWTDAIRHDIATPSNTTKPTHSSAGARWQDSPDTPAKRPAPVFHLEKTDASALHGHTLRATAISVCMARAADSGGPLSCNIFL
jgi:hypothetical protein